MKRAPKQRVILTAKDPMYQEKPQPFPASRFSVAPMMDWTDRHCRYFHRRFTRRALLFTEMVTASAIVHGPADRLLEHHIDEAPLALQVGGSDPRELAAATAHAATLGFVQINLNVGCPSDRVQSGSFGAALMRDPDRVADCLRAMVDVAGGVPITVKCRIGVDDQDPVEVLPHFLKTVARGGVSSIVIHARKAWLRGLSPKDNRTIPPLDYDLVVAMKERYRSLDIGINGGITDLDQAAGFLRLGLDGVMVGRSAYRNPALLGAVDRLMFGVQQPDVSAEEAVLGMLDYIELERARGTPLAAITRHMLGTFSGRPHARSWRRTLSEEAHKPGAGPELVQRALSAVQGSQEVPEAQSQPSA